MPGLRYRLRRPTAPTAAPSECPSCHAQADFDDIESTYFGYIAAAPPLHNLPAAVEAVIDGAPAKKQPFRVNKLVEDDLTILWLNNQNKNGTLMTSMTTPVRIEHDLA